MIEKDGNKIAVVLTAASAMAAGVSVYTMATSEEGQRVFQPSVLSLENGSEEFHTNYFINEVKKTPKMDDTFLKEAMALANSILAPLGKQQATPLTSEEIVLESTSVTAQDTPQESVEEIRLSGSPMEESQENHPIQPMVPQYVQTSSGPLQVSPITTSTVSVPSPLSREVNSVAMNLETSEFVEFTGPRYQLYNQNASITMPTTSQPQATPIGLSTVIDESSLEVAAQAEEALMVENEALVIESPEIETIQESGEEQAFQTIVMDSTGDIDALSGPAMAEEGTFMAMAEMGNSSAQFEEGTLSIEVEEAVTPAPGAEIPEPISSDPIPDSPADPVIDQTPITPVEPLEPMPNIPPTEPEPLFDATQPEPQAPQETEVPQESEVPVAPSDEMPSDPASTPADYSELNARIAEEALKLVDNTNGLWCTQVVQMAMANAGVQDALNLWPNEFADMYGYYTDNPQPGNLIYYNQGGNGLDHIAVYIGDGQAVHGNYLIDGESKTVIANAKLQGCDDYGFIQVER